MQSILDTNFLPILAIEHGPSQSVAQSKNFTDEICLCKTSKTFSKSTPKLCVTYEWNDVWTAWPYDVCE